MIGRNFVIVMGNVVSDPDVHTTGSGGQVANLRLAATETYPTRDGTKGESTEYVRCVVFGRLSGVVQQYLHKGDPVYAEGRLQTRKYTGKDGVDRYVTDVVVNRLQMLGQNRTRSMEAGEPPGVCTQDHDDSPAPPPARNNGAQVPRAANPAALGASVDEAFGPDNDIPF